MDGGEGLLATVQFPAVLTAFEGRIEEYGSARPVPDSTSLEFFGEFVPLLRMGETVTVIRLLDGVEAQVFTGQVYLSTRELLRLVDVTETILPPLLELSVEVEIPAFITLPPVAARPRLFSLKRREETPPPGETEATIYTLSPRQLTLRCQRNLPLGQVFTLRTPASPGLTEVVLEVAQVLAFGAQGSGYRCRVMDMPPESRERLLQFLWGEQLLFPAVNPL